MDEKEFKVGDRVIFDNGGEDHYGRKSGDLGVVVRIATAFFDSLVTVDWDDDKGVQEIVYSGRLRLLYSATPPEPPSFVLGDQFVLAERYYGEPHDGAGDVDVVIVSDPRLDPTGGVGVTFTRNEGAAKSISRFRVHHSRLNNPHNPKPAPAEPLPAIQVPVQAWGVLTVDPLGGHLVEIRQSAAPERVSSWMHDSGGALVQMSQGETDALIDALIAVRESKWGSR